MASTTTPHGGLSMGNEYDTLRGLDSLELLDVDVLLSFQQTLPMLQELVLLLKQCVLHLQLRLKLCYLLQ